MIRDTSDEKVFSNSKSGKSIKSLMAKRFPSPNSDENSSSQTDVKIIDLLLFFK